MNKTKINRSKPPAPVGLIFILVTLVLIPNQSQAACANSDYADELILSNFAIVNSTPLADDLQEVTLSAEITNTDEAELTEVIATPDFSATNLDVLIDETAPPQLEFATVSANQTKASTTDLLLKLPSANINELLNQLNSGAIIFRITGNEKTVFQPDIIAFPWKANADYYYIPNPGNQIRIDAEDTVFFTFQQEEPLIVAANINPVSLPWYCPEDEAPFLTDNNTWVTGKCYAEPTGTDTWYIYENSISGKVTTVGIGGGMFPEQYRRGEITTASYDYLPPAATNGLGRVIVSSTIAITPVDPKTTDITEIIRTGAYCTDEGSYLAQPVAQTRHTNHSDNLESLPQEPLGDEDNKYKDVQPMRFNNLQVGDLTISGQVQGYAIKPSLSIRIRPGSGVKISSTIENDLNMAVQLTAERDITLLDQQGISLGALCFPLPPLPVGVVTIPMSLHLTHKLGIQASVQAGVTLGIEKQFKGGYTVGWDTTRADSAFYSESFNSPKPLSFTPPRLTDDSAADAAVSVDFRATLKLADYSSLCTTGIGPYLNASLTGSLHASPTQDPWWTMDHDAELSAGLSFDLLGMSIIDQSAPLVALPGAETLAGSRPTPDPTSPSTTPPPSSGIDQRWAINIEDVDSSSGKIWETDIAATADGGAVIITSYGSPGGNDRLLRLDASGQLLWDKHYDGIDKVAVAVEVLDDGHIMVAGKDGGANNIWLAQHSANGDALWNKTLQLQTQEGDACKIKQLTTFTDSSGQTGFVISGTSGSTTNYTARPCLMRLDADGNPLWSRTALAPLTDPSGDRGNWTLKDLIATRDGGFLFVGSSYVRAPSNEIITSPVAVKLDKDGNVLWHIAYNIPPHRAGTLYAAAQAEDGRYYFTGKVGGTIRETAGLLAATLNEDGEKGQGAIIHYTKFPLGGTDDQNDDPNHWTTTYDTGTPWDTGFDIVAVDGGAVLVGSLETALNNGLGNEAWVIRVNPHLGVEWFTSYDGPERDSLTHLAKTDHGLLAAGVTQSIEEGNINVGKSTLMVMKLPFEGLVTGFKPELDIYHRYVLPTVFQGPAIYDNNPMISAYQPAEPYEMRDGVTTDLGSTTTLLRATPSQICATRLTTNTGVDSPLYPCDRDKDGIDDPLDNCPTEANADQADMDGDGLGDVCDPDSDGDGMPNQWESDNGLNPLDATDASTSADDDSLSNLEEYSAGTNPTLADTDGDGVNDDSDALPLDINEWLDSDGDGIGNNADPTPFPPTGTLAFAGETTRVDEDGGSVTLTVERSGGSYGSVSADFTTQSDTAKADTDYLTTSGTLNFADGETSQTITIEIRDDAKVELNERFTVELSNAQGTTLGSITTIEVTITDDDRPTTPPQKPAGGGSLGLWELLIAALGLRLWRRSLSRH